MKRVKRWQDIQTRIMPATIKEYVGVEIEFLSPFYREALCKKIMKLRYRDDINLGNDYSVNDNGENDVPDRVGQEREGHEMRILATKERMPKVLAELQQFFIDAEAVVNSTCGLHVHLDVRNKPLHKTYTNLFLAQKALFKLVPRTRRRSEYCRPEDRADVVQAMNGGTRRAINAQAITKHGTIEVRLHHGTLDMQEIIKWIELLHTIVASSFKGKANAVSTLVKKIKANAALKAYMLKKAKAVA